MKQLLYIGHEYHLKTKSTQFLFKIFEREYEITFLSVDPYLGTDEVDVSSVAGRHFDLLVCLQVMPSINRISAAVAFDHAAFFPMADYYYGAHPVTDPIWDEYREFHILCFSKKVFKEVSRAGYDAKYLQYFPEPPAEIPSLGDPKSVFFWQRVTHVNLWTLYTLLLKYPYERLHLHRAMDPGERAIEPFPEISSDHVISESTWFDTREQMLECMTRSAIYMASRPLEGIGMSFLEAMAYGRCVLAEDNTTMNEYIVHGKTGFLYSRGDALAPLPISSVDDIVKIQKNVIAYMKKGWERWKTVRERIPAMCESRIARKSWLKVAFSRLWLCWLHSLKGYGIEWTHVRTVRLLGVPVLTCKKDASGKSCRLTILKIPVFERRYEYGS